MLYSDLFVFWLCIVFFFFKQKTAYEMRISDWSSDVCSSDLIERGLHELQHVRRMNAEGQMDRGFIERFSGVNAAARHIKHIAGRQDQLRRGRKTFPYKYLALLQFAARHIAFLFVDMPALRSLDLEDDDVMIVIMRQKALRARRRDIGVDLRLEIARSEERRVGKEGGDKCRYQWWTVD